MTIMEKVMRESKGRIGAQILQGLEELVDTIESGERVSDKFTCHRVVLNLEPTTYDGELVRKTRRILGASQSVFARFLGASVKAVQSWEQGASIPSDVAGRFMDEIRRDPGYWRKRFQGLVVNKKIQRKAQSRPGSNRIMH